jgi:phosphoheptose isomerase
VAQKLTPYDPFGFGRDLHYNQDDSNGQRKPELKSFYEAVAKTLQNARQILLFGTGTGSSSAMEHLLAELKRNHKEIAARVVGSLAVDEHHLSEDQLLAKARGIFKPD